MENKVGNYPRRGGLKKHPDVKTKNRKLRQKEERN